MDQAAVDLFRVDHRAKELVEAGRPIPIHKEWFKILTLAGLEMQIFVDPKDANNVPAELKGKIREEVQDKGNAL